jgi:type I restriction enzyme M protein
MPNTPSYEQAILEYLRLNDPEGEIVTIDPTAKEITYKPPIKCHQKPKYESEGYIRAYLIVRLINELGYPPECIELENDLNVKVGRTKKHKGIDRGRSDILLFRRTDDGESLFLGIECKIPAGYEAAKVKDLDGQLWGIAKAESIEKRVQRNIRYLALYTIEEIGKALHDKVLIVDYRRFPNYAEWTAAKSVSSNTLPAQYEDAPQSTYANIEADDPNHGLKSLSKNYTRADFEKLRDKLHNQLWAGSSTDDNAIFYQLTKIFLAKIYDELHTDPDEPYDMQIRSTSNGQETPEELYERLAKRLYEPACRTMLNYDDEKLLRFSFLVEGFTKQKLWVAVKELQGISLTENSSQNFDVLGSFFEGIMTNQDFFKQSKGCYFTHPNIVRFMLAMVGIDELAITLIKSKQPHLPYLIDPSNGSGTFLIEAMKFITARVTKVRSRLRLNRAQETFYSTAFQHSRKQNIWAEDYLYGIEPRAELGLAAKVNMILHGDGNMNVFIEDGLHPFRKGSEFVYDRKWQNKDPGMLADTHLSKDEEYPFQINGNFDVAVSNPPFSLMTEALDSTATHDETFLYADASNSENLFIERYYQLLSPGGRLGIVLPESVFDTSDNKYIRLFLYRYFFIDAVVSLPQEAFQPFTSTKVSLLFATKKTDEELQMYNTAWNKATLEYSKLRKSQSVQLVLENDRLLFGAKGLLALCAEFNLTLILQQNILDETTLTPELTARVNRLISELPEQTKKEKDTKKELAQRLTTIREFVENRKFDSLPSAELEILRRFLRQYFHEKFTSVRQVCEQAYDEITEIARLDWPDYSDKEKYTNSWWCFAAVTSRPEFGRPIFFAEAQNMGYKRTRRGEQKKPNELYVADEEGFPIADKQNPKTIFDYYALWKSGGSINSPTIGTDGSRVIVTPLSTLADSFFLGCRASLVWFILEEYRKIDWSKSVKFKLSIQRHRSGEYIPRAFYSDEPTNLVYLSVNNFTGKTPNLDEVKYLDEKLTNEYERIKIKSGDLIITRSGTIGHAHIVELPDDRIYIPSHHLLVVELTEQAQRSVFLQHWLRSKLVKDFLWNFAQGKSQKEITNWSVKNLPIPNVEFSESQVAKIAQLEYEQEQLEKEIKERGTQIAYIIDQTWKSA